MEPMADPDQVDGGCRMPTDSPGKLRPLGRSQPMARSQWYSPLGPSSLATSMVPMLEERASIWVAVRCSVPWGSASEKTAPPTVMSGGTVKTLWGVMSPSVRAPAKVASLATDPGSYTVVSARGDDEGRGGPPWPATRLGMARMSPVLASRTTAQPALAWLWTISRERACSASYSMALLRVRTRLLPGTAGFTRSVPPGMARPAGSSWTTSDPLLPRSTWLYWPSSPE